VLDRSEANIALTRHFEVRNLQAEVLGGHVAADLTMLHVADLPEAHVEGTVRGVSLAAANAALRSRPMGVWGSPGVWTERLKQAGAAACKPFNRSDATITAQAPMGRSRLVARLRFLGRNRARGLR
jgi:hypothetical protein